jgi:hypothetical protein
MQQGSSGNTYNLGRLRIDTTRRDLPSALNDLTLRTPQSASNGSPSSQTDRWGFPIFTEHEVEEDGEMDQEEEDDGDARQDRFRLGDGHPALVLPETMERNQAIDDYTMHEADNKAQYQSVPIVTYKLSSMKSMYDRKDYKGLLGTMKQRARFEFDQHTILLHSEGKEFLSAENSRIDFKCIVGSKIGLGAIMRRSPTNQTVPFTLQLNSPHLQFHHSHGELGLDPTGNILYAGKRGDEEVWLAFAPDRVGLVDPSGPDGLGTHLTSARYRMVVLFLAYALNQLQHVPVEYDVANIGAVTLDPTVSAKEDVRAVTNLL